MVDFSFSHFNRIKTSLCFAAQVGSKENCCCQRLNRDNDFKIARINNLHEVMYSNDVSLRIESTDENISKLKKAKGKSLAGQRAEQIKYSYKIEVVFRQLSTRFKKNFVISK
jgi:hypothetical protein